MSEMSVQEAYKILQAECEIEAGDKVRIVRAFSTQEMGTTIYFNSSMANDVGKTFIVSKYAEPTSNNGGGYEVNKWFWPFFCLELVEKAQPKPPPIMVGEHEVKFLPDAQIEVCDVMVSKETLQEILERLEN